METILRPAKPECDFRQLAAWFSLLEDEPSSESGLKEYYEKQRGRIIQKVAENEQGELQGFYWATRDRLESDRVLFFLYVKPEQRRQGIGHRLYDDWVRVAGEARVKKLRIDVWDTCPEGRGFAERRGFTERLYKIAMALDLQNFDDQSYDEILAKLKGEGFQFTSMEELGNTDDAQYKLYILNETTSMDIPDADGEPSWASFDDFQRSVCQSDWYKPGGQMVIIDTTTGTWAAMSAITRLAGNNYAYNLYTGVDRHYRGRKLGQVVKVLALRYARDVLKANQVRTHHNAKNLPMIAINRKLGYRQMPGTFSMEKVLA